MEREPDIFDPTREAIASFVDKIGRATHVERMQILIDLNRQAQRQRSEIIIGQREEPTLFQRLGVKYVEFKIAMIELKNRDSAYLDFLSRMQFEFSDLEGDDLKRFEQVYDFYAEIGETYTDFRLPQIDRV